MGSKESSKKSTDRKRKGCKRSSKADAQQVDVVDTNAALQETEEPASAAVSAVPDVAGEQTSPAELAVEETPAVEVEEPAPKEPSEPSPASDEPTPPAIHAGPVRDPRLPPVGSTITRKFKGRMLEVTVLEEGFDFEGSTFSSLSRLASRICGAKSCNGYSFFRLGVSAGGAGATRQVARLANNITRIEKLTARMRAALAQGALALADAEAELEEMKKKVGELQQS
jgi:hypothetical protein